MHGQSFIFVLCLLCSCFERSPGFNFTDKSFRAKFAQFYCTKHVSCKEGKGQMCAVEMIDYYIARFDDVCTFERTNCEGLGVFQEYKVPKKPNPKKTYVKCELVKIFIRKEDTAEKVLEIINNKSAPLLEFQRQVTEKQGSVLQLISNVMYFVLKMLD